MRSVTLKAPAKLNLGLRITGILPNGFHSLESVFSAITLADEVEVAISDGSRGTSLRCTGFPSPEGPSNLVWKAAELFRAETGYTGSIYIRLHKNIPSPGGLGGGSSDTAAVIRALVKLTGLEVDVIELGSALGSDVPFFAGGFSHAVVRGRGELVEGCSVPEFHAVLVSSGERIPTPVAYSLWDEGGGHLTEPWQISNYTALNFGVWHEGKPFPVRLDNDFLPVLSRRFPGVERAAGILSETCVNWGLSGSGPVFYALYPYEKEAVEAEENLSGKFPWVFRCRSRQIGASSNG